MRRHVSVEELERLPRLIEAPRLVNIVGGKPKQGLAQKEGIREDDWLFPSRGRHGDHVTTRQYGRLLDNWVALIGLDPALYGTHILRRTKVALIYKRTGSLRACQLLLEHRTEKWNPLFGRI